MDFAIDCGVPTGLGTLRAGTWSAGQLNAAIPPPLSRLRSVTRIIAAWRGALILGSPVIVESLLGRVGQQLPNDVADLQGAIVIFKCLWSWVGERSVAQYEKLVRQANRSKTATTPLPSGYVLVEANGEDWSPMRGVNASQRPPEE
jgi:hypothetical protein